MVMYAINEIEPVLKGWVRAMRTAPEELSSTIVIFPGFGTEPPPMLMVLICYAGDEASAEEAVRPLRELGTVLHQALERKPYYKMLEDAVPPPGLRSLTQNGFIKTIDDDVIAALAANYGRPGTGIIQLRSLGGAVARVSPDATAFAHRDYEAFVLCASLAPANLPDEQAWHISREAWAPIRPFAAGGYINFMTDLSADSLAAAYPSATHARLAAIKAIYDPENIFNQNGNIKPA
jgi:hypothetical protein